MHSKKQLFEAFTVKTPKLVALSIFVIFFGATTIPAQAPEAPHETGSLINGRSWSNFGENTKLGWLIGYTEGLRVAASLGQGGSCEKQLKKVFDLYPQNLSFGEIQKAVDHFYQDTPENAPIRVSESIKYVTLKAAGTGQSELDDFAASLRKLYAAAPAKP